jgi:hypothetical protein
MAKIEGASREEVLGAVVLNLHHSGLASVMECLPRAVKGFENHLRDHENRNELLPENI